MEGVTWRARRTAARHGLHRRTPSHAPPAEILPHQERLDQPASLRRAAFDRSNGMPDTTRLPSANYAPINRMACKGEGCCPFRLMDAWKKPAARDTCLPHPAAVTVLPAHRWGI